MYRLAAFDMDGTLLLPDHTLGEKTLATLRQLTEKPMRLTFATGRHYLEMKDILANIGMEGFLITGNGTRIHDLSGHLLHASDLPEDCAHELLHTAWDTPASQHVFRDDGWFTALDDPDLLIPHQFSGFRYHLQDLRTLPDAGNSKVCFCAPHETLLKLVPQLKAHFGNRLDLCFSAHDCLDVQPAGCNKGSALTLLTAGLEIKMSECMAFGDAMNDREMLESVGMGLIMGNALPVLKEQSPHLQVIGHCRNQAVSHFLQHWLHTPNLTYSPEY